MEFLHPRDLLHTAFTCKSLRDMVSTSMVIKSALVHGGHGKSTMEVVYSLTSVHAMHIPSPLRLLRLVNGKICEFCLNDKVNHARPGIGVFACWACVTSRTTRNNRPLIRGTLTKPWKMSWSRYKKPLTNRVKYDAIFTHDRGKTSSRTLFYSFFVKMVIFPCAYKMSLVFSPFPPPPSLPL
jgi:hypothetical protein